MVSLQHSNLLFHDNMCHTLYTFVISIIIKVDMI